MKPILRLLQKGRVEPILQTDQNGVQLVVGFRRKAGTRKTRDGDFMLKRPRPWRDPQDKSNLTIGVRLVMAERRRQVEKEGWTAAHDERHADGELARAAECYEQKPELRAMQEREVMVDQRRGLADPPSLYPVKVPVPRQWPWDPVWWKPTPQNRVRELVKAGALYLAEAERLRRLGDQKGAAEMEERSLACVAKIDLSYGSLGSFASVKGEGGRE